MVNSLIWTVWIKTNQTQKCVKNDLDWFTPQKTCTRCQLYATSVFLQSSVVNCVIWIINLGFQNRLLLSCLDFLVDVWFLVAITSYLRGDNRVGQILMRGYWQLLTKTERKRRVNHSSASTPLPLEIPDCLRVTWRVKGNPAGRQLCRGCVTQKNLLVWRGENKVNS